jgi:hypothetical protein
MARQATCVNPIMGQGKTLRPCLFPKPAVQADALPSGGVFLNVTEETVLLDCACVGEVPAQPVVGTPKGKGILTSESGAAQPWLTAVQKNTLPLGRKAPGCAIKINLLNVTRVAALYSQGGVATH